MLPWRLIFRPPKTYRNGHETVVIVVTSRMMLNISNQLYTKVEGKQHYIHIYLTRSLQAYYYIFNFG